MKKYYLCKLCCGKVIDRKFCDNLWDIKIHIVFDHDADFPMEHFDIIEVKEKQNEMTN